MPNSELYTFQSYLMPESVGGSDSLPRLNAFFQSRSIVPKDSIKPLFYKAAGVGDDPLVEVVIGGNTYDHGLLASALGESRLVRRASLGLIVSCFGEGPALYEDIDNFHDIIQAFKKERAVHDLVIGDYNPAFGKNISAKTETISDFELTGSPEYMRDLYDRVVHSVLPSRRYVRGQYWAMEYADGQMRNGFKLVDAVNTSSNRRSGEYVQPELSARVA